jgi:hypothetical protein
MHIPLVLGFQKGVICLQFAKAVNVPAIARTVVVPSGI